MKYKLLLLISFIRLSGVASGQEPLIAVKDTAHIFSVLNGNYPQPKSPVSPIYKNTYVLNEQEKDSIINAVYTSEKTQKLLYRYEELKTLNVIQRIKNEEIFLPENQIHLVSILSSALIPSETKQQLLIGKIEYDQSRTTSNMSHRFCGTNSISRAAEIIAIHSKDAAITAFIDSFNEETWLNFSGMTMVFIPVNKNGKPSGKNATKIPVDEKLIKIRKTKIQEIVLLSQAAATALYGSQGKHGVLLVYCNKQ